MDIKEKVAEKLDKSSTTVIDIVVDKLAEIEINKRVATIQSAMIKLETLEKEFKKIEGKNDTFYYIQNVKHESMSENRFNAIKKAKETYENLNKAFNLALETNSQDSYNKLNGLLGNKTENSGEVKSEA